MLVGDTQDDQWRSKKRFNFNVYTFVYENNAFLHVFANYCKKNRYNLGFLTCVYCQKGNIFNR